MSSKTICDLPPKLVGEKILTKVPITSLSAVRSTSKLWDALSKDWIVGEAEASRQQFLVFMTMDSKALGYDINRNHYKILRFVDNCIHLKHYFGFEIYDFGSKSWRILDVRPDWEVEYYQCGVTLKGNTYFFAHEKSRRDFFASIHKPASVGLEDEDVEDFLLCFDFTTERFGPRLPLSFHSYSEDIVTLSCVREEQLAVLYQQGDDSIETLEIWVTTKIDPSVVSWSKFLKVDMRLLLTSSSFDVVRFDHNSGSFFIDEEEKVAVVFDVDGFLHTESARYHTAFIIGDDGFFKSVSLGEAPNVYVGEPGYLGYTPQVFLPPSCVLLFLSPKLSANQPPTTQKESRR
ncbi:PREDICTED: F-box/kelch-repeat protein At1g24800-like [Camelina sativa]|uniref:F-box/kelch-repeat protein At1g24800-like n=1 Tax=Camelina sativa TaxID=90675 RepID=A0ABM0X5X7_CAMSA|nr:PREDICTED: F-box/kelch-repeat protein At1g24800-like [Camelina sativa]